MVDNLSRYIYEVYRVKSVSLAAQNLYISQPALSAAIRKVEQELGTPIFNRKTLPFTLTAEGRIYIEGIEKMLELEARTRERVRSAQQFKGGTLRVASSAHISHRLLPKILRQFHNAYPQVESSLFHIDTSVLITEKNSLFDLMEKSRVDVILLPLETEPDGYHVTRLFPQHMVVALPAHAPIPQSLEPYGMNWQELADKEYSAEKVMTDLSLFQSVEFVHMPPGSYISKRRTSLFGKFDVAPHVLSNTSHVLMNYNLMLAGFGALLTTDCNIITMPPNDDCRYFVLSRTAASQDFCAVYSTKDNPGNLDLVHAFVDIAKEMLAGDNYRKLLL